MHADVPNVYGYPALFAEHVKNRSLSAPYSARVALGNARHLTCSAFDLLSICAVCAVCARFITCCAHSAGPHSTFGTYERTMPQRLASWERERMEIYEFALKGWDIIETNGAISICRIENYTINPNSQALCTQQTAPIQLPTDIHVLFVNCLKVFAGRQ